MRRLDLKPYFASFRHGWIMSVGNKSELTGVIVVYMILLLVFGAVYKIMPIQELGHAAITENNMIWYLAVTELVLIAMYGNEREMGIQIADGQLTTMLRRPGSMMGLLQSRAFGNVLGNGSVLAVIGFVYIAGIRGMMTPLHLVHLPFFILSVLLAVIVMLMIGYVVGMVEVHGPYSRSAGWIMNKLIFTFGGLFFPVMFYPQWLQNIVYLTPGPAVLFIPGRFMLEPTMHDVVSGIAIQMTWIGILFVLGTQMEKKLVHHVLTVGD